MLSNEIDGEVLSMAQRKGTDVWRLPPVDAPDEPSKGMRFWVQTGDHWAIGDNHSVSRVSSRSFYISHAGGRRRHALDGWFHWLSERDAEGFVVLEGRPMRRPAVAALAAGLPRMSPTHQEAPMRIELRDARLLRAVRNVVRNYDLVPEAPTAEGLDTVHVSGGQRSYVVHVDPEWRRSPRCSCPDAERMKDDTGATFCKHTIAVLLTTPDHRHQLIDLLL